MRGDNSSSVVNPFAGHNLKSEIDVRGRNGDGRGTLSPVLDLIEENFVVGAAARHPTKRWNRSPVRPSVRQPTAVPLYIACARRVPLPWRRMRTLIGGQVSSTISKFTRETHGWTRKHLHSRKPRTTGRPGRRLCARPDPPAAGLFTRTIVYRINPVVCVFASTPDRRRSFLGCKGLVTPRRLARFVCPRSRRPPSGVLRNSPPR